MSAYQEVVRVRMAGDVKRWHTKRTNRVQTLASHQWGVAALVQMVDPQCRKEVIMAALTHDLSELDTGDIPAPVKWKNPGFAQALAQVERESNLFCKWEAKLDAREQDLLKWADAVELLFWSQEEVDMGNRNFSQTVKLILERIEKMPTTEHSQRAADLIHQFKLEHGYYESK